MTNEENELLTRVGPGTPMGNLFRQFWFPVVPSAGAPEAGRSPIRMKLLGEDLVMFRDIAGRVGLLGEHCSHRCASLYFGRNEDGGLRCVYHGWLYSVEGRCLEMPNEASGETLKGRILHPSYPCREVNGTIWTYMGPRRARPAAVGEPDISGRVLADGPATGLPPLPEFGLAVLPANQKRLSVAVRECNYLQSLEGDLDLSHGAYLHSFTVQKFLIGQQNHLDRYTGEKPHMEAVDTPYGVMHLVRRNYDDEHYHAGVGHYFFPFMTMFPPVSDTLRTVSGHIWVSMDDYSTLVWSFVWHPSKPTHDPEWNNAFVSRNPNCGRPAFTSEWDDYAPPGTAAGDQWRQRATLANDFGYDEEAQRTTRFTGVPGVNLQDRAMQEGIGPIVDRTHEHLGPTDTAQLRVRKRLLDAAKALQERGEVPGAVDDPSVFRFRCASGLLPKGVPWVEGTREWVQERPDNPVQSRGHWRPAYLEPAVARQPASAQSRLV